MLTHTHAIYRSGIARTLGNSCPSLSYSLVANVACNVGIVIITTTDGDSDRQSGWQYTANFLKRCITTNNGPYLFIIAQEAAQYTCKHNTESK